MSSRRTDNEIRRRHRCELYNFTPYRWRVDVPESPLEGEGRPKGRSGHRLVFHDGCFYSFGGYNPEIKISDTDLINDPHWKTTGPLFKELWRYNIHSKRWTKLPVNENAPEQLASHSCAIYGQKLLVYGGTGMPFGLTTSTDVYMMDLKSGHWETLETTPEDGDEANLPKALYGQAIVVYKGNFYTVGGTSGNEYFMEVHRLNLTSKKWKRLHRHTGDVEEPSARYRHGLCIYSNRILVFGGGTSFTSHGFDVLPAFNLETNKWEQLQTSGMKRTEPGPSMAILPAVPDGPPDQEIELPEDEDFPEPRRCHSLVTDDKGVFIIGGFDGDDIFKTVWRLDFGTLTWGRLPFDIPKALYFSSAVLTDSGKAYIFGGVSEVEGNRRTRKVYSAWTRIPNLRDMCWDALNHYVPALDGKPTDELLKEGLPGDLIDLLKEGMHTAG